MQGPRFGIFDEGEQLQSVLSNVRKADVAPDPFPHVAAAGALPDDLCSRLMDEFPALETVTEGQPLGTNQRFTYPARAAVNDPGVSQTWKEFVGAHVSQAFLGQVVELFGEHIRAFYPSFESDHGSLDSLRAGVRGADSFDNADVLLDAQICVNSPVVEDPSSVRPTHVDDNHKLFAGLFYLRDPRDDSTGGDLELVRYEGNGDGAAEPVQGHDARVEISRTVKYDRNVLVLFLNSAFSFHGVTVRSRTPWPRRFLNLVVEVQEPLFDLKAARVQARAAREAQRAAPA